MKTHPFISIPIMSALFLAVVTAASLGQTDPGLIQKLERQQRQLDQAYRLTVPGDQPISERTLWDYGGTLRFGLYGIDDEFSSTRVLRQTDASLYLLADVAGAHRFYGELRFTYNDFNSGDAFGTGQYGSDGLQHPIGDQYWYLFDLRGAALAETGQDIDHNLTVKVGRPPTPSERGHSTVFLREQARALNGEPTGDISPDQAATIDFCTALFNLNAFMYVD